MSPSLPGYRRLSFSTAARNEKARRNRKNSAVDTKIQSMTPLPLLSMASPELPELRKAFREDLLAFWRHNGTPVPLLPYDSTITRRRKREWSNDALPRNPECDAA